MTLKDENLRREIVAYNLAHPGQNVIEVPRAVFQFFADAPSLLAVREPIHSIAQSITPNALVRERDPTNNEPEPAA